MAHILIAATSNTYRDDLAHVLRAAGHHVSTTGDAALAQAILQLSQQPVITLLTGDLCSGPLMEACLRSRHPYIMLTNGCVTATATAAYAGRAYGRHAHAEASSLQPSCSIGELLTAVEFTAEQLSRNTAQSVA